MGQKPIGRGHAQSERERHGEPPGGSQPAVGLTESGGRTPPRAESGQQRDERARHSGGR